MEHPVAPSPTSKLSPAAHSGSFTLSRGVVYDYSVAVSSGTATISFTGDSAAELSTAQAEALLDALRYANSDRDPTASSDRVLTVIAYDGAGLASNTTTSTITVVAVNDAPTLDLDTTDNTTTNYAFTFTEGDSATAILTETSGTSLADVDSTTFDKVTVAFTQANFADDASESLSINGATSGGTISNLKNLAGTDSGTFTLGGVVYDYSVAVSSGTATISFTGDSAAELSTAQAEALLDALRYDNSDQDPTASSDRVLTVIAYDGDGLASNTTTSTITVVAVNDAPTLDLDTTDSPQPITPSPSRKETQPQQFSPKHGARHSPMSTAPPSTKSPSLSHKPTLLTMTMSLSLSMEHPAAPSNNLKISPAAQQAPSPSEASDVLRILRRSRLRHRHHLLHRR